MIPGEIFVFQAGGFGDVVLTSHLIGALRRSHPDKRIVLGVDSFFQQLPALFPMPPDEVCALNLGSFLSLGPTPDVHGALRAMTTRLAAFCGGTFIDATHRPHWIGLFLAAALRPQKALSGLVKSAHSPALLLALTECGLVEPVVSTIRSPRKLTELERHRLLSECLCGSNWLELEWTVSAAGDVAALDWLRAAAIPSDRYLLCAPCGAPSVLMKRWPIDRFIEVLNRVCEEEGLSVVFAGSRAEVDEMQAASKKLSVPSSVYFGLDLHVLAALINRARVFLGNDSGLAHLAQALNVRGVTVFGGGTWPAYAPWGSGMTGVIHSLPCFECYWDCLFDHALCVEGIAAGAVAEQLRATLHSSSSGPDRIDVALPDSSRDNLIQLANVRYRAITDNYEEMGHELERVCTEAQSRNNALEEMARELDSVRTEAQRRKEALEQMAREFDSVNTEAQSRNRALEEMACELDSVRTEAQRRKEALEQMAREFDSVNTEAQSRNRALEEMACELDSVRTEAQRRKEALEQMAREFDSVNTEAQSRNRALEEMACELDSVRTEAARRAAALGEMNRELLSVYSEAERRSLTIEAMHRELGEFRAGQSTE